MLAHVSYPAQAEVDLLKKLEHENIVRLVGKDENERYLYIFMEYVF